MLVPESNLYTLNQFLLEEHWRGRNMQGETKKGAQSCYRPNGGSGDLKRKRGPSKTAELTRGRRVKLKYGLKRR